MVEGDLERAEERAEAGESKIVDLEEELRVIGRNQGVYIAYGEHVLLSWPAASLAMYIYLSYNHPNWPRLLCRYVQGCGSWWT